MGTRRQWESRGVELEKWKGFAMVGSGSPCSVVVAGNAGVGWKFGLGLL